MSATIMDDQPALKKQRISSASFEDDLDGFRELNNLAESEPQTSTSNSLPMNNTPMVNGGGSNVNPSHSQPSMHAQPNSYQNPGPGGGSNQPPQAHPSVLQELLLSNNPSASTMNSPRPPYGAAFNTRYDLSKEFNHDLRSPMTGVAGQNMMSPPPQAMNPGMGPRGGPMPPPRHQPPNMAHQGGIPPQPGMYDGNMQPNSQMPGNYHPMGGPQHVAYSNYQASQQMRPNYNQAQVRGPMGPPNQQGNMRPSMTMMVNGGMPGQPTPRGSRPMNPNGKKRKRSRSAWPVIDQKVFSKITSL